MTSDNEQASERMASIDPDAWHRIQEVDYLSSLAQQSLDKSDPRHAALLNTVVQYHANICKALRTRSPAAAPVGVTEAMVDEACVVFDGLSDAPCCCHRDDMRAAITAALAATPKGTT